MLLHRNSESGCESVDHNDLEHLHWLFTTLDLVDPINTVSLFDNNSDSKAIHSAFNKHYRNVQYYFVSAEHDIGELYLLESTSWL